MKILFTIPTEPGVKERFQAIAPEAEFHFAEHGEFTAEEVQAADIIIGNVPPAMIKASKNLRFFQTNSAGSNISTVPG
ncbi:MAG: D-2-hydroxyacid dehydrogenase, partial [Lachnospiraceae bacterium]|nr:D-2-hydroxyacid dehydrogenase [Lachnospiraceae bacterium]